MNPYASPQQKDVPPSRRASRPRRPGQPLFMAAALVWCLVLLSLGVGERGVIFPLALKATCTGISLAAAWALAMAREPWPFVLPLGGILAVEVLLVWVWH